MGEFNPADFVQPAERPVDWAVLEEQQRARRSDEMEAYLARQSRRNEFDVTSRQNERQLDQADRGMDQQDAITYENSRAAHERESEARITRHTKPFENHDVRAQLEAQQYAEAQERERRKQEKLRKYAKAYEAADTPEELQKLQDLMVEDGLTIMPGSGDEPAGGAMGVANPSTSYYQPGAPADAAAAQPATQQQQYQQQTPSLSAHELTLLPPLTPPMAQGDRPKYYEQLIANIKNPELGVGVDTPSRGSLANNPEREELQPMTLDELILDVKNPRPDRRESIARMRRDAQVNNYRLGKEEIAALRIDSPAVNEYAMNAIAMANELAPEYPMRIAGPTQLPGDPVAPPDGYHPGAFVPPEAAEIVAARSQIPANLAIETDDQGGEANIADIASGKRVARLRSFQEISDASDARLKLSLAPLLELSGSDEEKGDMQRLIDAYVQNRNDPFISKVMDNVLAMQKDKRSWPGKELAAFGAARARNATEDRLSQVARQNMLNGRLDAVTKLTDKTLSDNKWPAQLEYESKLNMMDAQMSDPELADNPTAMQALFKSFQVATEKRSPTDADARSYQGARGYWDSLKSDLSKFGFTFTVDENDSLEVGFDPSKARVVTPKLMEDLRQLTAKLRGIHMTATARIAAKLITNHRNLKSIEMPQEDIDEATDIALEASFGDLGEAIVEYRRGINNGGAELFQSVGIKKLQRTSGGDKQPSSGAATKNSDPSEPAAGAEEL